MWCYWLGWKKYKNIEIWRVTFAGSQSELQWDLGCTISLYYFIACLNVNGCIELFASHTKFKSWGKSLKRAKDPLAAANHHCNNQNPSSPSPHREQPRTRTKWSPPRPWPSSESSASQGRSITRRHPPRGIRKGPYLIAGRLPLVPPCVNQVLRWQNALGSNKKTERAELN